MAGRRVGTSWKALDMGGKAGVISAVVATLTAAAGVGTWAWSHRPADLTQPGQPREEQPAARTETPLSSLTRLGGAAAGLPAALRDRGYTDPLVIACPSNRTGEQSSELTFETDGRFVTFTATVSGWSEQGGSDAFQVTGSTTTVQPDDSRTSTAAGSVTAAMNGERRTLTVDVEGTDELTIGLVCHRTGGYAVLDDPHLTD